MKMPAFSQFYQIHIEFKILKAVCVCVCVCARTRAQVCVFDKKRIGTHTDKGLYSSGWTKPQVLHAVPM